MSAAPARPNIIVAIGSFTVGVFTRNLGAKISALILAVVVWFTVRQDISQQLSVYAQVNAQQLTLEGLMPVGTYPTRVMASFRGPASEIAKIRELGSAAELFLQVREGDMVNDTRRTLVFSIDNGKVEHLYGDKVQLETIDPREIEVPAAVKSKRELPIAEPTTEPIPGEWKLDDLKFTQKIFLEGPKDSLDALTAVLTKPIPVAKKLTGNGDRETMELTGFLDLEDEIEKQRIRPVRNERIAYTAVFRRTRVPKDVSVPLGVRYETLDSKVRLEVDRNGPVQLLTEGLRIKLTFTGSQADLDKVQEGVEDGTIRAYVRADDNEDFRNGKEGGGGRISPVRVEMPEGLRRRVSFKQPEPSLTCKIVKIDPR